MRRWFDELHELDRKYYCDQESLPSFYIITDPSVTMRNTAINL